MVTIAVQEEWRANALAFVKKTGYSSARTGKLAEYAVIQYFRSQGVWVKEDHTVDGPDHFDLNLGSTLIDVKSCLAPAKELRITKDHFDRGRRFAFYIGCQIPRTEVEVRIVGFCTKDVVAASPAKRIGARLCYVVPFSRLQPIEQLVQAFRKES